MWPGHSRESAAVSAGRRADSDFESLEVPAAEQIRHMPDDSGRHESQTRRTDGGVDDDHDAIPFDGCDLEAFRPGNVEVAFQRVFAAPKFVRPSNQISEIGRIIGYDGSDCLPWTEVFRK